MRRSFLIFTALVTLTACTSDEPKLVSAFFDGDAQTRVERLRKYSLEDQYKICRYGYDSCEPPRMELAEPIAERGSEAIPFLKSQIANGDALALRDILSILELMSTLKTYNAKDDLQLMSLLKLRIGKLADGEGKATCIELLSRIRGKEKGNRQK